MPAINHALASAAVIGVGLTVAAAIALYESPEFRRLAEDVRRRIAIALHSLGDGVNPADPNQEPLFNRPEDAEGFLQSRGNASAERGVDADEETLRRQRAELMYWNALREEQQEKDRKAAETEKERPPRSRGSSFDDFLRQDGDAEKGAYVYHTGSSWREEDGGLVQRRRPDGIRGLNSSAIYANPFADEYGMDAEHSLPADDSISPGRDEVMSDIYNATDRGVLSPQPATSATVSSPPALVDAAESSHTERESTLERELADDEFMTAGRDDQEAYASIQAWAEAQTHNPNFYSPLPHTPEAPMSEPEMVSEGMLTPTDSVSLIGSGEHVANDARSETQSRDFDVISEDSEGMMTPVSWSEVGSVVSESESAVHPVHA